MEKQVIDPIPYRVPSNIPMVLTPKTAGTKIARILAVTTPQMGLSKSDVHLLVAQRFGKSYDWNDFDEKWNLLVASGHLQESEGMFFRTTKGTELHDWIEAANPDLIRGSTSVNVNIH